MGIGHTWEARVKLDCLTPGCCPAFWLLNWDAGSLPDGDIDVVEWFGNGEWPANTTVHGRSDGKTLRTIPITVEPEWHTWRIQWDEAGFRFWRDHVDGAAPYFEVPGYSMFPIFNVAVGGPGGGNVSMGTFPRTCSSNYIRVG